MSINQKGIMKTAASHLRNLSNELQKYRSLEQRRDYVERILEKNAEALSGEDILKKYSEYMKKNVEELKILEKAMELAKTGEFSLGTLSTRVADNGGLDPLTSFLVEECLQN